jgi:hypothetical protein
VTCIRFIGLPSDLPVFNIRMVGDMSFFHGFTLLNILIFRPSFLQGSHQIPGLTEDSLASIRLILVAISHRNKHRHDP